MGKQVVIRSTELFIEHTCGAEFAWIPNDDIDKISLRNPLTVKCPKCGGMVMIHKIVE